MTKILVRSPVLVMFLERLHAMMRFVSFFYFARESKLTGIRTKGEPGPRLA
jgi:hypothetical protein